MLFNLKDFGALHGVLFIYAIAALCEKFASTLDFLSLNFFVFYIFLIAILGIYAVLWQQILKKMDLNVAFANKAITVVWGMILGFLIFNESISLSMIIGAAIVICGIYLISDNAENF